MKIMRLFLVICIYFNSSLSILANEPWSFEKHPQPNDSELTIEELLAFKYMREKSSDRKVSCRLHLDAEYTIYLKRYPEYLAAFDEREQIKQWRRHIASNPKVQEDTCLYRVMDEELYQLNWSPDIGQDFMFCGHYSREPKNRTEARAKRLIDEVITFSHFGTKESFSLYHHLSSLFNMVYKPVELHYYFARLEDHYHPSDYTRRVIKDNSEFLTKERIAFLDKAAATGDYQAVLNTLPACNLRDKQLLQELYEGLEPVK